MVTTPKNFPKVNEQSVKLLIQAFKDEIPHKMSKPIQRGKDTNVESGPPFITNYLA